MLGSSKAAVWQERLRRYQRSELTVIEFCQYEGVSVPSFYQWRRRLAENAASPRPPQGASTSTNSRPPRSMQRPATPAFQQVVLPGSVVAIEFPSGVRVELPAAQVPLVRAIVTELLLGESHRGKDA